MWYKIAYMLVYIAFLICPVRVKNRELIPDGAAILCPNHTCLRDPVYVALAIGWNRRFHFMAKAEIMDRPFVGWLITLLGAYRVDRKGGGLSAIRESRGILKSGGKIVIFPEGTRVRSGMDVEAKSGAAMLAASMNVPIIPVAIRNGRKWFHTVDVIFGEPILIERAKKGHIGSGYHEASQNILKAIEKL